MGEGIGVQLRGPPADLHLKPPRPPSGSLVGGESLRAFSGHAETHPVVGRSTSTSSQTRRRQSLPGQEKTMLRKTIFVSLVASSAMTLAMATPAAASKS